MRLGSSVGFFARWGGKLDRLIENMKSKKEIIVTEHDIYLNCHLMTHREYIEKRFKKEHGLHILDWRKVRFEPLVHNRIGMRVLLDASDSDACTYIEVVHEPKAGDAI